MWAVWWRFSIISRYKLAGKFWLNPFTPRSDQFQISSAASPEILHHTVWRTWFIFIANSNTQDDRWLYYQFSPPHLQYTPLFKKVGRMSFLNLGVKGFSGVGPVGPRVWGRGLVCVLLCPERGPSHCPHLYGCFWFLIYTVSDHRMLFIAGIRHVLPSSQRTSIQHCHLGQEPQAVPCNHLISCKRPSGHVQAASILHRTSAE